MSFLPSTIPLASRVIVGFPDISGAGIRTLLSLSEGHQCIDLHFDNGKGKKVVDIAYTRHRVNAASSSTDADADADAAAAHVIQVMKPGSTEPCLCLLAINTLAVNGDDCVALANACVNLLCSGDSHVKELIIASAIHFTAPSTLAKHVYEYPGDWNLRTPLHSRFLAALIELLSVEDLKLRFLFVEGRRDCSRPDEDGCGDAIAALTEAIVALEPTLFKHSFSGTEYMLRDNYSTNNELYL